VRNAASQVVDIVSRRSTTGGGNRIDKILDKQPISARFEIQDFNFFRAQYLLQDLWNKEAVRLPRTVHVEWTENRHGDLKVLRIKAAGFFREMLGQGIRIVRARGRVLRNREPLGNAVDVCAKKSEARPCGTA